MIKMCFIKLFRTERQRSTKIKTDPTFQDVNMNLLPTLQITYFVYATVLPNTVIQFRIYSIITYFLLLCSTLNSELLSMDKVVDVLLVPLKLTIVIDKPSEISENSSSSIRFPFLYVPIWIKQNYI